MKNPKFELKTVFRYTDDDEKIFSGFFDFLVLTLSIEMIMKTFSNTLSTAELCLLCLRNTKHEKRKFFKKPFFLFLFIQYEQGQYGHDLSLSLSLSLFPFNTVCLTVDNSHKQLRQFLVYIFSQRRLKYRSFNPHQGLSFCWKKQ